MNNSLNQTQIREKTQTILQAYLNTDFLVKELDLDSMNESQLTALNQLLTIAAIKIKQMREMRELLIELTKEEVE
jgi:hypothetical protein